ncbi:hypothetical protein GCM10028778_07910 [Barrientosiimonas marina]|uniref:DsDNA nuclease domain-containing protein n=1 Tax=Lentibacillus kimchii TaxID=1542911 RepID=A0ABW2UTT9_9BACI
MPTMDDGGANAIRGFNYQKASIILVMIKNFQKQDFAIIPEADEDFDVKCENNDFYIQVKGTNKISPKKLMKSSNSKNSGDSILEKNMEPGSNSDIRKIFICNYTESLNNQLIEEYGDHIVTPVYSLSDQQKKVFINKLNLTPDQTTRLNNLYIFITPFINNSTDATTYLKGEMVNEDLITSNERAQLILGELSTLVDQKSEITITNEEDYNKKKISGESLKEFLITVENMDNFNSILESLDFNFLKKQKIRMEKNKIPLLFQDLKSNIKEEITLDSVINLTDQGALDLIINTIKSKISDINEHQLWAIAIDCFKDLGE